MSTQGTKFIEIWIKYINFLSSAFENVVYKMTSIFFRSHCIKRLAFWGDCDVRLGVLLWARWVFARALKLNTSVHWCKQDPWCQQMLWYFTNIYLFTHSVLFLAEIFMVKSNRCGNWNKNVLVVIYLKDLKTFLWGNLFCYGSQLFIQVEIIWLNGKLICKW